MTHKCVIDWLRVNEYLFPYNGLGYIATPLEVSFHSLGCCFVLYIHLC